MPMKGLKGSFTIEISILLPILFFVFAMVIRESIGFYEESLNREVSGYLLNQDLVEQFYEYQILEEIGGEILDEES